MAGTNTIDNTMDNTMDNAIDNTIDNTMQVRSIAKLCQDMPRLVALVHVSTAYCHCQEAHIQVTE